MRVFVGLLALSGLSSTVLAETPASFLAAYAQQAKAENPASVRPSAERGQQFFAQRHGKEWSRELSVTPGIRQTPEHMPSPANGSNPWRRQ